MQTREIGLRLMGHRRMIRVGSISTAQACIAAAIATLLWLASAPPAKAVDEFAPNKDCKPISYCVKYHKGEPGQLAGRCVRWAQILPCTPAVQPGQPATPGERAGVAEPLPRGNADKLFKTRP